MLEYLIKLPSEFLGQNMIGFLEMIDIIQLENAASSHESKQLLQAVLPYCPPIVLTPPIDFEFNCEAFNWLNNRHCRIRHARISINFLCEVNFHPHIFNSIELHLRCNSSFQHIATLKNSFLNCRVTKLKIESCQDPAVIEVLFSLLTNSCVHSLDIDADSLYNDAVHDIVSNISKWIIHIRKIGPCLRELSIQNIYLPLKLLSKIFECCPYLEKLSSNSLSDSIGSILQNIANNCSHLRSLDIEISYDTRAEKCPQLEELTIYCENITDQSVIALAQHCSRLKTLKLNQCKLTTASLIALSKRGLPLEELGIPSIPFPTAEIAAQCAYALSRIRQLFISSYLSIVEGFLHAIQYMIGLRKLFQNNSTDHLLISHLLLHGHCAGLESIIIMADSSITPQQFIEIVTRCCKLQTLHITKPTCTSDAVVVDLAHSCPQLQKVTLYNRVVTEEGVMALATHCRHLRELDICHTTVTEETVRQLAQHCPHLTKLRVKIKHGDNKDTYMKLYKRNIRAIRENF